jgi:SAM-dependent methyltransferase
MVAIFRARDYRRPQDHTERTIEWCAKCAYGRVAGSFTPDEVSSFYEGSYYTHGELGEHQAAKSFFDRLRVNLAWRVDKGLGLLPGDLTSGVSSASPSLCDVGCGNGAKMGRFKPYGYRVCGIEPDAAARAVAQREGEVFAGTAESLPQEMDGRRFDVVLVMHVLEHCIEPFRALENCCKLLDTDGTLVIETPNNTAAGFARFKALWPWTDVPRHLHFFTELSLRCALDAAGMKVTRVAYRGYSRQFDPEWIDTQEQIWAQLGDGTKPNFKAAAWRLLLRTAFASDALKYDSVRLHAVRRRSTETVG